MKNLFTIILLMGTISLFSQIKISQNCKSDIELITAEFIANNGQVSETMINKFPINKINNTDYLSVIVKVNEDFSPHDFEEMGIIVGKEIHGIVSLKVPLSVLPNLIDLTGIHTVQVAGKIKPDLDKVLFDTRVDSVHAGIGLPQSYAGNNVLIGVTDWGFDYSSPMFYDTLLQETRILAAWDQFKNSGPAPEGYNYGTEYATPEDLNDAQADTINIYSYATHGSHVSGIAGGSGAGTQYRGVAFEAQYLFATFLVDEASVLDAWAWMYDKSLQEDKRLVINMSWGLYHTGALDGTSLLSQALDGYSELGVLFVTSNGNNGSVNFHLDYEFEMDTLRTRVNFYNSASLASLWGQSIHGWGEPGSSFSAGINIINSSNQVIASTPMYSTATTVDYIDSYLVVGTNNDTIYYNLSMDDEYPTNDRPQMRFRIKKPPTAYKVAFTATAADGIVHFWNVTELSNDVGNWGMPLSTLGTGYTSGNTLSGVGAPACSSTALSVAAYSANYLSSSGSFLGGAIASFSSKGPLMTGNLKPEISAPGVNVASSISSYTDNSFSQIDVVTFNGRDYPFARFSGTSMSSPVVAGIAALILEANPTLSPAQVKQVIMDTAREDSHTGDIPDEGSTIWGHGKVDAYSALQVVLGITGINEIEQDYDWTIYPNPTNDILNVTNINGNISSIIIMDVTGRVCADFDSIQNLDISNLSKGAYWLRLVKDNRVEQQRFVVE